MLQGVCGFMERDGACLAICTDTSCRFCFVRGGFDSVLI